ncbi:hypothetical protein D9M71_629440 [compost metagenome]
MVEVPGHRAGGAQLALAEQHAHFGDGTVHVVGQALDDDRHPVRREAFIEGALVVDHLARLARTLLDGTLQGVLGHGGLLGLMHGQAQLGVHVRIGAVTCGDHDLFHQFAEDLPSGIGGGFFRFGFPLGAHGGSLAGCGRGTGAAARWQIGRRFYWAGGGGCQLARREASVGSLA